MTKTWAFLTWVWTVLLLTPFTVQAIEMTLHGTLIAPPQCTINDSGQVSVAFGDQIGINSVNGINHRKQVNYQITCDKGTDHYSLLTLTLSGNVAEFDGQVLKTNKDNLGVKIYLNDKLFAPDSPSLITLGTPPLLEAVLVKKSGSVLTGGQFEAWATLRAEYQ
ncbi:fimbrial protein [Serratia fonticola]|uniref:fimbrial protein n=1 Tax=Serratia fonticola TaxID=47917 RepID=UPI0015C60D81|nr:fimbrial protein [Serratia fonticola]MBC3378122.1 fimbrial protein [Serratia fonticola]NYA37322.1 fimbrial protein [Serratia fonticola]